MEFAVRQSNARPKVAPSSYPCPQCRQMALMLQRRHVSPERLGEPLVTEFYDCDCCDARYKFTPNENKWRQLSS